MIDLNDVTLRIAGKTLLENANAHLPSRKKVGFVGFNGCGKSTLFKAIQDEISLECGTISKPKNDKLVFMTQEIKDTTVLLLPFILSQDKERTELLKKLETASNIELPGIYERLYAIGASSAEARACHILKGLGFIEKEFNRPLSEFSGGWQMRVVLGATLFQPSDILLLDEPTNHLDLESALWLMSFLQKYKGTLLLISHDRSFLNQLCNIIVHFESKKLFTYSGNYDCYIRTRSEQKNLQQKMLEKQKAKQAHLKSFIDRFRYKATKAKQAQSRIKQLEKISLDLVEYETAFTHFEFPEPSDLSSPIVHMDTVSTGYDDKIVLKNLNLKIDKDDKIALLGANGNGKSTLAKLINGLLPVKEGKMSIAPKLRIGYFAQHQTEVLPFGETPVSYIASLMPLTNETKIRTHLARFGLGDQKALTVISQLSGGEKARLLFAGITCNNPQLLILDEPSNHLDIESQEGLMEALNIYKGAVLLVTHDLHLIETVADRLWVVNHQTCVPFDEDISAYQKNISDENRTPSTLKVVNKNSSTPKEKRRQQTLKFQTLKPIKDKIEKLETEMEYNQTRQKEIEKAFLNTPTPKQIVELQKELSLLKKRQSEKENQWILLNEKLEIE